MLSWSSFETVLRLVPFQVGRDELDIGLGLSDGRMEHYTIPGASHPALWHYNIWVRGSGKFKTKFEESIVLIDRATAKLI